MSIGHLIPLIAAAILAVSPAHADQILRGVVVAVADGDTVTVLDAARRQHKVRLAGIDAPERGQPFGERSRQNLASTVHERDVEIVGNKRDRYGRLIGKVMVSDPNCHAPECNKIHDAGLMQVMGGLAWHYKHYQSEQSASDRESYAAAESRARASAVGLWTDPHPVPPWDWRKAKRER